MSAQYCNSIYFVTSIIMNCGSMTFRYQNRTPPHPPQPGLPKETFISIPSIVQLWPQDLLALVVLSLQWSSWSIEWSLEKEDGIFKPNVQPGLGFTLRGSKLTSSSPGSTMPYLWYPALYVTEKPHYFDCYFTSCLAYFMSLRLLIGWLVSKPEVVFGIGPYIR